MRSSILAIGLLLAPACLHAQAALSGFAGSTLKGTYESDFDRLAYATELSNPADVLGVEGRFLSRIFEKPGDKSNSEILRSYQDELVAGGFDVHIASALSTPMAWQVKLIYDPPHTSFSERRYEKPDGSGVVGLLELAFVVGSANQYMVASRTAGGEERWVAVILSGSRPFYMVEEVTIDAMETGTVTLSLEAMRSEIDASGKIAVYDIHFATSSAVIEPESAEALSVVASYLSETPGGFYIVGHTDDTGTLETNMTLSDERAAAVKQALVDDHGVDPDRLETRGVGPLSPVSTNTDDAGRALNRRVEIVQRLP